MSPTWKVIKSDKFGETLWWVEKPVGGETTINVLYVMEDEGEPYTVSHSVRADFSDNIEFAMCKLEAMTEEQATGIIDTLFE